MEVDTAFDYWVQLPSNSIWNLWPYEQELPARTISFGLIWGIGAGSTGHTPSCAMSFARSKSES